MRTSFAWVLTGLLGTFSMTAQAQPPAAHAPSQKYPPLRLAGPASATPALPAAATPVMPATPVSPSTPITPGTSATPATPTPTSSPNIAVKPPADDQALDSIAQQHYSTGVEMFRNGLFDAARAEFEAAYKILPLPDLLHNLSMVSEQQKRYAEAVDFEERFLTAASNLTYTERATTKTRIAKLREQGGLSPVTSPSTSGTETAHKGRTPTGALALIGIGSGMLLVGIGCGAGALVTQNKLENGEPLFAREYEALTQRGRALNYTGISLDVLGGVALVSGAAWAIYARTHGPKPQVATASSLFSIGPLVR